MSLYASGSDLYGGAVAQRSNWARFENITIAGREAVRYGLPEGTCKITVRLGSSEGLDVEGLPDAQYSKQMSCDKVTTVARAVLENF